MIPILKTKQKSLLLILWSIIFIRSFTGLWLKRSTPQPMSTYSDQQSNECME